jgi:hypothetical protein
LDWRIILQDGAMRQHNLQQPPPHCCITSRSRPNKMLAGSAPHRIK